MKRITITILFLYHGITAFSNNREFNVFINQFSHELVQLNIPEITYDYRDYFSQIPSNENLDQQMEFFSQQKKLLLGFNTQKLSQSNRIIFDHVLYEIDFNLNRISLELKWVKDGRKIPAGGLYSLTDHGNWYKYFIKRFTSIDMEPEDIMDFGITEVEKTKNEITRIRLQLGYLSEDEFINHLKSDQFYLTDKSSIKKEFLMTDSIIRNHLKEFTGGMVLSSIHPLEWPEAGPYTPPGMYLSALENPYGKDVFLYNFYTGKYNSRCIDWLFMHEGIPGHHLQAQIRKQIKHDTIQSLFTYPGNFEGWACYVEYEGKLLGVYKNIYRELGKWEWDLIRSARIVMEVGIHYYGWSQQDAMDFWKANIMGQDEIAEREITRITNWPGQALSYKLGASTIMELKNETRNQFGSAYSEVKFNTCYLSFGMRPLAVIKAHFSNQYNKM